MPQPMPARPAPLAPAKDAKDDEVRFEDAPESSVVTVLGSVDIVLEDVSGYERLSSLDILLPEPREPSIDRLGTMAGFQLFAGASREALLALSAATELVEFQDGQVVFVKDAPATELYAIVAGVARVQVPGTTEEIRLEEGDIFGEGCLLGEGKRHADVNAGGGLMTLKITKKALDDVTAKHAEVGDALFQLLVKRLLTNLMSSSPLFASFDPAARLELTNMFEVRRAEPGTVIAEKGRRSDGLYVLLAGDLETTGAQGRIPRGTAFGHTSLFGGGAPSEQTVKARSEAILLRLAAAKFSSLAALYPPVLAHLATETDLLTS
jgi:CRP-like cAMP-binding protein